MARKGVETVVIRRNLEGGSGPGDVDDFYGEHDDNLVGVAVLDSCLVWPRASTSSSDRGVTTIEGLHIFVPPDGITWDPNLPEAARELGPDDHVLVRFKGWRLDGAVGDWRKKSGSRVGFMFEVRRWA